MPARSFQYGTTMGFAVAQPILRLLLGAHNSRRGGSCATRRLHSFQSRQARACHPRRGLAVLVVSPHGSTGSLSAGLGRRRRRRGRHLRRATLQAGLKWGNPSRVIGLTMPARSFQSGTTMGFAAALPILRLLLRAVAFVSIAAGTAEKRPSRRTFRALFAWRKYGTPQRELLRLRSHNQLP